MKIAAVFALLPVATFAACGDELMISGAVLGGLFRTDKSSYFPSAVELYSGAGVCDLSEYCFMVVKDGQTPPQSCPGNITKSDGSILSIGQELSGKIEPNSFYYMAAKDTRHSNPPSTGMKAYFGFEADAEVGGLFANSGNDLLLLYKKGALVDTYGLPVPANKFDVSWGYYKGYMYRKNGKVASSNFNEADWDNKEKVYNPQDGINTNEGYGANKFPLKTFSCGSPVTAKTCSAPGPAPTAPTATPGPAPTAPNCKSRRLIAGLFGRTLQEKPCKSK